MNSNLNGIFFLMLENKLESNYCPTVKQEQINCDCQLHAQLQLMWLPVKNPQLFTCMNKVGRNEDVRVWVPNLVPTDSFVNNWRRPGLHRLVRGSLPDYCRVHCCFVLLCSWLSQYIMRVPLKINIFWCRNW